MTVLAGTLHHVEYGMLNLSRCHKGPSRICDLRIPKWMHKRQREEEKKRCDDENADAS